MDCRKIVYFTSKICIMLFVMSSCSSHVYNGMVFDNVFFTGSAPYKSKLSNGDEILKEVDCKIDVSVQDSFLFVGTLNEKNVFKVFSLSNLDLVGEFFSRGHGKYEFMQGPFLSGNTSFYKKNNELCATIYNFGSGKIYNINFSESLNKQKLCAEQYKYSLRQNYGDCILLDSVLSDNSSFLVKDISPLNDGCYKINVCKNGMLSTCNSLEILNKFKMLSRNDTEILTSGLRYNYKHKIVIQIPIYMNYFNIIDLYGNSSKTICCGNEVNNPYDYLNEKNKKKFFSDVRVYNEFFVIRCAKEYKNSFLFYSYEGELLYELQCDEESQCFDIDLSNSFLYTVNYREFIIKRYDISNVLSVIKGQ